MIEEKKFDQRDVYANHVRIYYQIGTIYEPSSDIPKLCEIIDENGGHWARKIGDKIHIRSTRCVYKVYEGEVLQSGIVDRPYHLHTL